MKLVIRRYWPIPALLIIGLACLLTFGGATRIIPCVVEGQPNPETKRDILGTVDLFDDSIVHAISIEMSPSDLPKMISTYRETGEKDFFPAIIVIDGTRIGKVGIRLKGNSTLESVLGKPENVDEENTNAPRPGTSENNGGPVSGKGGPPGGPRPTRPPVGTVAKANDQPYLDSSRNLPYLIRFDEFEPGLRFQGKAEIVLRVRGHTEEDAAMLAELVTRGAFETAGLTVPKMAYAGVAVTGSDEKLYVVSEHVDETYVEGRTESDGSGYILYKSLPRGDFRYRGEDPSAYATIFAQKTQKKHDDLAPLVELIRFVAQASDEEFAAGLSERVDMESLFSYLTVNNLLVNMDSLGGNGNNYYLLYSKAESRFRFLPWDMNESLGQFWLSESKPTELDPGYETGFPMKHRLLERLLAVPAFASQYTQRYESLFAKLFGNSEIFTAIDRFEGVFLSASATRNLLDPVKYRAAAETARNFLAARYAWLREKLLR